MNNFSSWMKKRMNEVGGDDTSAPAPTLQGTGAQASAQRMDPTIRKFIMKAKAAAEADPGMGGKRSTLLNTIEMLGYGDKAELKKDLQWVLGHLETADQQPQVQNQAPAAMPPKGVTGAPPADSGATHGPANVPSASW
jgi:hypothetical protein